MWRDFFTHDLSRVNVLSTISYYTIRFLSPRLLINFLRHDQLRQYTIRDIFDSNYHLRLKNSRNTHKHSRFCLSCAIYIYIFFFLFFVDDRQYNCRRIFWSSHIRTHQLRINVFTQPAWIARIPTLVFSPTETRR